MSLEIKVPSIACEVCAETISKAIQSVDPDAKITVDVSTKIVSIDTEKNAQEIKEIIVSAGHTPE